MQQAFGQNSPVPLLQNFPTFKFAEQICPGSSTAWALVGSGGRMPEVLF
jgi:hypothetical protein